MQITINNNLITILLLYIRLLLAVGQCKNLKLVFLKILSLVSNIHIKCITTQVIYFVAIVEEIALLHKYGIATK